MKTNRLIIAIVLNASLTACLPNSGFRDDQTSLVHGDLDGFSQGSPATSADDMSEDEGEGEDAVQGGINIGSGSESEETPEDVEALEYPVEGVGYETEVRVTVQANKILKLRFAPQPQAGTVAGTNYAPNYGHLGVYIKVGTLQQPTPLLSAGLITPPQVSPLMNFSTQIPKTCGDDPECRVNVVVKIIKPNYDFYCLNYPGGWNTGSGWYYPCNPPGYTHVHKNHPWNGMLYVWTDDTGAPAN